VTDDARVVTSVQAKDAGSNCGLAPHPRAAITFAADAGDGIAARSGLAMAGYTDATFADALHARAGCGLSLHAAPARALAADAGATPALAADANAVPVPVPWTRRTRSIASPQHTDGKLIVAENLAHDAGTSAALAHHAGARTKARVWVKGRAENGNG
jgi:hypothetical protein